MKVDEQALKALMAAVFQVPVENITDDASTDTIATWDSLHHINLIVALEDELGIRIDEDEVPNLTSYKIIKLTIEELPDR